MSRRSNFGEMLKDWGCVFISSTEDKAWWEDGDVMEEAIAKAEELQVHLVGVSDKDENGDFKTDYWAMPFGARDYVLALDIDIYVKTWSHG